MKYWNQWRPKTPPVKFYGRAAEIREMRKEGLSTREIAEELGISQANVMETMKRNGIG